MAQQDIESALRRHERIALQFSGGRDSLAALYLLREHWDRLTVYHCDTGDQFHETRGVVERVQSAVPKFVRVPGRLNEVRSTLGFATDLLPASHTPLGMPLYGTTTRLIDRGDCCFLSLMQPLHERMMSDGVTLIIRGQRDTEFNGPPPLRSGAVCDGVEFMYPIQDWTDEQVMEFLENAGVSPPRFYGAGMRNAPECVSCTGWWGEGKAAYLKKHHPAEHRIYIERLKFIRDGLLPHLDDLTRELEGE